MNSIRVECLGDRAIVAKFLPERIAVSVNARAIALAARLAREPLDGVADVIPGYASVSVVFREPFGARRGRALARAVETLALAARGVRASKGALVEIPVTYGGPDLAFVAGFHRLSEREVVRLHSRPVYRVYQLGFTPGFPYLGGLPRALETPRLETPRPRVAAGSVGIGGAQTGVYTVDCPGGWRIIGRTDLRLFDPSRDEPALLRAGMRVRFREA